MKGILLIYINFLLIGLISNKPSIETHGTNVGKKISDIFRNYATVKCGKSVLGWSCGALSKDNTFNSIPKNFKFQNYFNKKLLEGNANSKFLRKKRSLDDYEDFVVRHKPIPYSRRSGNIKNRALLIPPLKTLCITSCKPPPETLCNTKCKSPLEILCNTKCKPPPETPCKPQCKPLGFGFGVGWGANLGNLFEIGGGFGIGLGNRNGYGNGTGFGIRNRYEWNPISKKKKN